RRHTRFSRDWSSAVCSSDLAVMGLLDASAQISGEILYGGKNLLAMGNRERASLRGTDIAMIYQDALSSLNPSMLIRAQMRQLTQIGRASCRGRAGIAVVGVE